MNESKLAATRIERILKSEPNYLPESQVDVYAVRDILTDIIHFCNKVGIDFDDRVDAAKEVAFMEI